MSKSTQVGLWNALPVELPVCGREAGLRKWRCGVARALGFRRVRGRSLDQGKRQAAELATCSLGR